MILLVRDDPKYRCNACAQSKSIEYHSSMDFMEKCPDKRPMTIIRTITVRQAPKGEEDHVQEESVGAGGIRLFV